MRNQKNGINDELHKRPRTELNHGNTKNSGDENHAQSKDKNFNGMKIYNAVAASKRNSYFEGEC